MVPFISQQCQSLKINKVKTLKNFHFQRNLRAVLYDTKHHQKSLFLYLYLSLFLSLTHTQLPSYRYSVGSITCPAPLSISYSPSLTQPSLPHPSDYLTISVMLSAVSPSLCTPAQIIYPYKFLLLIEGLQEIALGVRERDPRVPTPLQRCHAALEKDPPRNMVGRDKFRTSYHNHLRSQGYHDTSRRI